MKRPAFDLWDFTAVGGASVAIAGLAQVSVPLAMIVAGCSIVFVGILGARRDGHTK